MRATDEEDTEELIRQALEIGESEGYVRIFLDEGDPVIGKIRKLVEKPSSLSPPLLAYARRLVKAL
jgi:hypothetical protein